MKKLQRTLCWLLTLATVFTLVAGMTFSTSADATTAVPYTEVGSCGRDEDSTLRYSYYDPDTTDGIANSVLTISGDGVMENYKKVGVNETTAPWFEKYASEISKVIIGQYVTDIGQYAFAFLPNLTTVEFADTLYEGEVLYLHKWSFAGNTKIESILFPFRTETVYENAFNGCTGIKRVVRYWFTTILGEGNETIIKNTSSDDLLGPGETPPEDLTPNPDQGGTTNPDQGGTTNPDQGGTTNPDQGGTTNPDQGGTTNPDQGGSTTPSTPTFAPIVDTGLEWIYYPDTKELLIRVRADAPEDASLAIPDYKGSASAPWLEYAFEALTITIKNGVTGIGDNAFKQFDLIKSITIPKSVAYIGKAAYASCKSLESIYLKNNKLEPMKEDQFVGCENITLIDFEGYREEWDAISLNASEELTKNIDSKLKCIVRWSFTYNTTDGSESPITDKVFEGKTGEPAPADSELFPHDDHYIHLKPGDLPTVFGNEDMTREIRYEPRVFTVTVICKDPTGLTLKTEKVTLKYGETLVYDAPVVAGYKATEASLTLDVSRGNTSVTFNYTPEKYFYTIVYVNSRTGETIRTEVKGNNLSYGDEITVDTAVLKAPDHYTFQFPNNSKSYVITDNSLVVEIPCVPDHKTVTIEYVDDLGRPIAGAANAHITIYYSEDSEVLTLPELAGHITPATDFVIKAEEFDTVPATKQVKYERKTYTVTINFGNAVLGGGMPGMEPLKVQVRHGDSYTFKLSEHPDYAAPEGYVADVTEFTVANVTGDTVASQTVNYSLKKYDITISFYKELLDGSYELIESVVAGQVQHAGDFALNLSQYTIPTGYLLVNAPADLTNVTSDLEVRVNYTLKSYTVTIEIHEDMEDKPGAWQPYTPKSYTVKHGGSTPVFDLNAYVAELLAANPNQAGLDNYIADRYEVQVNNVTKDETVKITITKKSVTVKVEYKDGDTVVATKEFTGKINTPIEIPALTLEGYLTAEGFSYTLGTEDGVVESVALTVDPNSVPGTDVPPEGEKTVTVKVEYKDGDTVVEAKEFTGKAGTLIEIPALTLEGYLTAEGFSYTLGTEDGEVKSVALTVDPNSAPGTDVPSDDENDGCKGVNIWVILLIILVVLVGGGLAFYFLYLKDQPDDEDDDEDED